MGAYNVPAALAEAKSTGADGRAALLTALLPLTGLLKSAKPWITKRRHVFSKAEPADPTRYMTCQLCGRGVAAQTGLIALHGFRRPGGFGQTRSCKGAGHPPLEYSRDLIGQLIADCGRQEAGELSATHDVEFGSAPVTVRVPDRSAPLDPYGRRKWRSVEITRENADAILTDLPSDGGIPLTTFDDAKSRDLAARESRIKDIRRHTRMLKDRYERWTMTHDWSSEAKGWQPLVPRG